jgi:hypothetical protein
MQTSLCVGPIRIKIILPHNVLCKSLAENLIDTSEISEKDTLDSPLLVHVTHNKN